MNTRRVAAIAFVVALVALAGCMGGGDAPNAERNTNASTTGTAVYDDVTTSNDVVRFVDREAGVVCYYYAHPDSYAGQGGLSCVPMNQTDLN